MTTTEVLSTFLKQSKRYDMSESTERALVLKVAHEWLRTPYVHASQIKKVGCDCGTFLIGVYAEAKLIEWFKPKPYTPDFMLHKTDPAYLNLVLDRCKEIGESEARPADLVMWKIGYLYAHGAIIDHQGWDRIIHAYKEVGHVTQDHGLGGRWGNKPRRFFSYWAKQ